MKTSQLMCLALALITLGTTHIFSIDIEVTTTADGLAPIPAGSLRAALLAVNTNDRIIFRNGGIGTIQIVANLPTITRKIEIDAYDGTGAVINTATNGSSNALLTVQIQPASVTTATNGLTIGLGGSETIIKGLAIYFLILRYFL